MENVVVNERSRERSDEDKKIEKAIRQIKWVIGENLIADRFIRPQYNANTGKMYNGHNKFALSAEYKPMNLWVTFKQADKLVAHVKAGEKASQICFFESGYQRVDENGNVQRYRSESDCPEVFRGDLDDFRNIKWSNVFSLDQLNFASEEIANKYYELGMKDFNENVRPVIDDVFAKYINILSALDSQDTSDPSRLPYQDQIRELNRIVNKEIDNKVDEYFQGLVNTGFKIRLLTRYVFQYSLMHKAGLVSRPITPAQIVQLEDLNFCDALTINRIFHNTSTIANMLLG